MNRFPAEILNEIFALLHQYDKIECMLVCQHWADVIKKRNLFNMIQCSKWSSFKKLMDRFQKEPSRGRQVQHLVLALSSENSIDCNTLLKIFPNLKYIYLSKNQHILSTQSEIVSQQLKKCYIEYIKDISTSCFTTHLLSSFQCFCLNTLHVSADYTITSGRALIGLLHNCPNLETLTMGEYTISLDDLELLHSSVPRLRSLAFPSTYLLNSRANSIIEASVYTTTLSIITVNRICEVEINWLRYINLKYPNLESFSYRNIKIRNQLDLARIEREGLKPIVHRLKSLSINIKDYGPTFFKTLEESTFRGESLDLSGPVQLGILDAFYHFGRANCIQHLKLFVKGVHEFGWLQELPALRKLELSFSFPITNRGKELRDTIQFNSFLTMCSNTLDSLTLGGVKLDIDISKKNTAIYSMKYLEFFSVLLPNDMDNFISMTLPQLKTLILQDCGLNDIKLYLPYHHLSYLMISEGECFANKYVLLVTNKEKRWFTARANIYNKYQNTIYTYPEYPPFPPSSTLPYSSWNSTPSMTIVCASVNKFMILHPYN